VAGRGEPSRGWGALVAVVVAAVVLWIGGDPLALISLPAGLLLLALPPRRPGHVLLAAVALGLALAGAPGDSLWRLDRGWALLLGAWFLVALLVLPRAGFLSRALAATAATALSAGGLLIVQRGALAGADHMLASRLRDAATQLDAAWRASGAKIPPGMTDTLYRLVDARAFLAPAEAALASLAALAAAWWVYRRVTFEGERPLTPLRDFRFRDELIWLLIAGIGLVVVPGLGHGALRVGSNVLTFMGALYALRGLAVLLALAGGGLGLGWVLLGVLALLSISPLVVAVTVLVGLTDTWLDLRARLSAPAGPGN
jgi:hypothetical protein